MTESPRRNIFGTTRSRVSGFLPARGTRRGGGGRGAAERAAATRAARRRATRTARRYLLPQLLDVFQNPAGTGKRRWRGGGRGWVRRAARQRRERVGAASSPPSLSRQNAHVAVAVKGAHAADDLVVVAQVNEDLCVVLHAAHQNRERPGAQRRVLVGRLVDLGARRLARNRRASDCGGAAHSRGWMKTRSKQQRGGGGRGVCVSSA